MLPAMSPTLRRLLIVGIILLTVILLGSQLRTSLGIDLDVESVRAFADGLGPLGPLLFVGVVAGRGLLALPSQVVLIAAGLCFGTVVGTFVGATGLMLSGLGVFLGVRYAGRGEIEKRVGKRLGRILDASGQRAGAVALALGSGYPISPLTPIHAAAGLTPMTLGVFVLAAFSGGALRASVFSYFGDAITESSRMGFVYAVAALLFALALPLCFERGRSWLKIIFGIGANGLAPSTPVVAGARADGAVALQASAAPVLDGAPVRAAAHAGDVAAERGRDDGTG
jgi:uncharacterized membrane protein YdjX (TVP38/TMEM64 family)